MRLFRLLLRSTFWLVLLGIGFFIFAQVFRRQLGIDHNTFVAIGGCLVFFPIFITCFVGAVLVGGGFVREAEVAATPIPTPAEIQIALTAEWQRLPTVEEVAAVHQMLTNRHNQALVNAGLGLGALYLALHDGRL